MAYTVLARKYRSRTFDEVIGQAAVTTTLRNAITSARVHHGYLFCGTRGTGKTSMARILAKSLNCLSGDAPTLTPCGKCDSCVGVSEGEDIDVLEIDAASNTGVDSIRELRSNAAFRPARSRYKIFIVDEVHMLSTAAFNALLKTLEEPPEHVKFIFATTDPQKVPATIQSRCQRFDFKPIPPEQIAERLAYICAHEEVKADPAALKRVARLANGSLRDGVSLLDQLLSVCGSELKAETVDEFLPAPHDEVLGELIDALAAGDAAAALAVADRSLSRGQTADLWCSAFVNQMRDLMMLRVCGAETDLVDVPAAIRPKLSEQAHKFDAAAYVFMISVLEELRRAVKYSGSSRALIEAALVRLSETAKFASIESLLAKLDGMPAGTAVAAAGTAPANALPAAGPSTTTSRTGPPATGGGTAATRVGTPPAARPATAGGVRSERGGATSARTPIGGVAAGSAVAGAVSRGETGDATPAAAARPAASGATERTALAEQAAAAVRAAGRPRSEDIRAAMNEPLIQQAMELFDGSVVNVQRVAPPAVEG